MQLRKRQGVDLGKWKEEVASWEEGKKSWVPQQARECHLSQKKTPMPKEADLNGDEGWEVDTGTGIVSGATDGEDSNEEEEEFDFTSVDEEEE